MRKSAMRQADECTPSLTQWLYHKHCPRYIASAEVAIDIDRQLECLAPGEMRLLVSVLMGYSLGEYAYQCGVSLRTAGRRWRDVKEKLEAR